MKQCINTTHMGVLMWRDPLIDRIFKCSDSPLSYYVPNNIMILNTTTSPSHLHPLKILENATDYTYSLKQKYNT